MSRWQRGHATGCNPVDAGSNPALFSKHSESSSAWPEPSLWKRVVASSNPAFQTTLNLNDILPNMEAKYHRDWYHKNRDRIMGRKLEGQKKRRVASIEAVRKYKAEHGCADCGESDPIVLDLDHLDQDTKFKSVANMIMGGYGLARIMQEAEKCEVVCANCHRRRTATQCCWN